MQNAQIIKLRQTIANKEFAHKFSEIISTNIRLNGDQRATQIETIAHNPTLPTISNNKLALNPRLKSQSAKRIQIKSEAEKGVNRSGSKHILRQVRQVAARQSNKLINKAELLNSQLKGQSYLDNSGNRQMTIRTKIFSLKTQSKAGESSSKKGVTGTKDVSTSKQRSSKAAKELQIKVNQFSDKLQKLNAQLLLTIKMGKMDQQSADNKKIALFLAKMKTESVQQHNRINSMINKLLSFVQRYRILNGNVEFANIIGQSARKVHSNYELVSLFVNKLDILKTTRIVGLQYYTEPKTIGRDRAANKITSFFKMIFSRRFYQKFRALLSKVLIIQRYWRTCLMTKRFRKRVLERANEKLSKHKQLQQELAQNWNVIKVSQRYEIHICSYSLELFKRLTTKNFKHKENCQITRIFRACQHDVSIIYVAPFQLHEEVIKYYASIFDFSPEAIFEKLYFILPENHDKFRDLSTLSALMYSPKALKRIKQIIGNSYACIVPAFPSIEFANLSAELNVPILGPNQNVAKLYSTKSGSLKVLKSIADKQKPPFLLVKSVRAIFSEKQLINTLAVLIHKNKSTKVWYLKIEDDIHSRGISYLNINKIGFLRQLCSGESELGISPAKEIELIAEELNSKLRHRLKFVNKDIYANYDQFLSHFLTRGGVIEAAIEGERLVPFSVSFFIEPNGQFSLVGTYNKLELGSKSINQCIKFPSEVKADYQQITRHLYKELWQKQRLFGYFTVDLILAKGTALPYAIGLDCFLNEKTASLSMINFCCGTTYCKDSNKLTNKMQQFHYIYCPVMSFHELPTTAAFFKGCKYENISYDLERKLGTLFILLDKIENGQLGFLCVNDSVTSLLNSMKKMVGYFSDKFRVGKNSNDEIGLLKGVITTLLKRHTKQQQGHFEL